MDKPDFKKRAVGAVTAALAALLLSAPALAAELPDRLVPVGEAVGISVKTRGVMVSELSEFEENGTVTAPARDAGLLPGDVITRIDGVEIDSSAAMSRALASCGDQVTVVFERGGRTLQATLRPHLDGEERYLGVWVRDGLTGIGTVTYYDPNTGDFGALGHAIADSATGVIVPVREGAILDAQVTGVTKGRAGDPGQLGGSFDFSSPLGDVRKNCDCGIFGSLLTGLDVNEAVPAARAEEVKPGPAVVISDASGQRRAYAVEITRVYRGERDGRDMMLRVTDRDLLDLTGGIVQGMSGSPILQDGKLVGAVTHVLINDPEKGYGVFLENMLNAA